MNCREAQTLLSAHADGELDVLRSHALGKHLRGCAECAAAFESMLALRRRVDAEVPRRPSCRRAFARQWAPRSPLSPPGRA